MFPRETANGTQATACGFELKQVLRQVPDFSIKCCARKKQGFSLEMTAKQTHKTRRCAWRHVGLVDRGHLRGNKAPAPRWAVGRRLRRLALGPCGRVGRARVVKGHAEPQRTSRHPSSPVTRRGADTGRPARCDRGPGDGAAQQPLFHSHGPRG